jgi:DNA-binding CsgD family transcriptional regulator
VVFRRVDRPAYRGGVAGTDLRRAADKITRICAAPGDLVSLWRETTDVLVTAVPHHITPCFYTLDPASLLMTSHYHDGLDHFPHEWLVAEYADDDVNQLAAVARSGSGISTLHDATRGDPSSSPRWHRNMTLGGDQELVARLRTKAGQVWGALALYRAPGDARFSEPEKAFIGTIAPVLGDAARRALLVGQAREPDFSDAPALVVLDQRLSVESTTPGAERWLHDLPDGDATTLPPSIVAVAAHTLRCAHSAHVGEPAVSRVRGRSGTWVVLHGAVMMSSGAPRVAVIIEAASPARLYPLLMSAYGLTEREKDVTELVLQGASTSQIAGELFVSAHTVQQHLKSIFDKTGVRSRRELVGRVFFSHFEPRVRDNEQRVLDEKPVRGEPWRPAPDPGVGPL